MSKITTVILLALAGIRYAQAAEATVITLSCDGTLRESGARVGKAKPVKNMGVIANLAEKVVSFSSYGVHIDDVTAADITFSGETTTQFGGAAGIKITVVGDIDRVTGAMTATTESPIW